MSAYILDDKSLNKIVAGLMYAKQYGDYTRPTPKPANALCDVIPESPAELGKTLYHMNRDAVEQRYPDCIGNPNNLPGQCNEDGSHKPYTYKSMVPPQPVQLYKSLKSFLYQCDEGNVDELPLYHLLENYCDKIARHILENSAAYEK